MELRFHTDTYPHMSYILETTIIGLHFAADNIGLSSLKFSWWAHKFCLAYFCNSDVSAV